MKLAEVFKANSVIYELKARAKSDAIKEMMALLKKAKRVSAGDEDALCQAVLTREELGSTGIGKGGAVPHAKHPGLKRVVGALARAPEGLEFDAIDGQPVYLIFLLLAPPDKVEDNIAALRRVTMLLQDDDLCAFMRRAETKAQLVALLAEADERLDRD